MLKSTTAVMLAAAIAAAVTILSAPAPVDAGPLAKPAADAMTACAQRPWPYLRCVGTEFGNPRVRLVTAERLAQ